MKLLSWNMSWKKCPWGLFLHYLGSVWRSVSGSVLISGPQPCYSKLTAQHPLTGLL